MRRWLAVVVAVACTGPSELASGPPPAAPPPTPTAVPVPRARWLAPGTPARQERARARHLVLGHLGSSPPAERTLEQARAEAERLWLEVEAGADLAALASLHSDGPSGPRGGDLGAFEPGTFDPGFEAAITSVAPGALAPLVHTRQGVHVARREPLDEVRVRYALFGYRGALGATVTRSADQARSAAAEAATRLRAGTPVDALGADRSSPGTLLGRHQWAPALEARAWRLQPGEVSEPIETPGGWIVLSAAP